VIILKLSKLPKVVQSRIIVRLPQELLNRIFSYLSKQDLQATSSVSKDISISIVAAANFNEPHAIKSFFQILIQKLNIKFSRAKGTTCWRTTCWNCAKYNSHNSSGVSKFTALKKIYFRCEIAINRCNKNIE
jgi:hypothetical protein